MELYENLVKLLESKNKTVFDIEMVKDINRPNMIFETKIFIVFLSSMGKGIPMEDLEGVLGLEIYGKDWKIYFTTEDEKVKMNYKKLLKGKNDETVN